MIRERLHEALTGERIPFTVSEREQRLLKLAPVAKAYVYETGRVNTPALPVAERIQAKYLRDAFMDWMQDDAQKGGKILGELLDFEQWDFERRVCESG